MPKIRVGVVGAHFGAKVHAKAFALDRRAELVAIAARTRQSSEAAARELGIPRAYTDWRAMLKHENLDAVSVAVPPRHQPAILRAALGQKIAVLAEKPLALDMREARKLAALARKSRVAHMIDYEFSSIPAWIRARQLLEAGAIGALRHISVLWRVETYTNRLKKVSWKTQGREGGGALSAFGCHTLHALEWFAGPARRLSAHLSQAPDLPGNGDTLCSLTLEWDRGFSAQAEICTHAFPSTGHEIRFFGEKGSLQLLNTGEDYIYGFQLSMADRKDSKLHPISVPRDFSGRLEDGRLEAVSRLVKSFLDWIERKKPARPDFSDALRVERLLRVARLSASRRSAFVRIS